MVLYWHVVKGYIFLDGPWRLQYFYQNSKNYDVLWCSLLLDSLDLLFLSLHKNVEVAKSNVSGFSSVQHAAGPTGLGVSTFTENTIRRNVQQEVISQQNHGNWLTWYKTYWKSSFRSTFIWNLLWHSETSLGVNNLVCFLSRQKLLHTLYFPTGIMKTELKLAAYLGMHSTEKDWEGLTDPRTHLSAFWYACTHI